MLFRSQEEVARSADRQVLNEFLLRLHGRYLGCRLGYDTDGALVMMTDIYPGILAAQHVVDVMRQMDAVAGKLLPLLRSVVDSGELPAEPDVDAAFQQTS